MIALLGSLVILLAVAAILRRYEVRLVLLITALALGALAGDVPAIVRRFLIGFTDEKFLLPLGTCMGFAYVLRHTGCDQHLIHLLMRPLQRVRFLLIPGVALVAATVNVPIISQSSTAVAVGTVLVPVLQAARLSPTTIGATLAFGASIGGELLNPGAPELRTVSAATNQPTGEIIGRIWPLLLVHLAVAVPLFWWLCAREEKLAEVPAEPIRDDFRINPLKALVPILPLVLLFITAMPPPLRLVRVPPEWLGDAQMSAAIYDGRLVGLAMMVGVAVAILISPRKAPDSAKVFFEGAGYALANITSLIICANCFGDGVKAVGLAHHLEGLIARFPGLLYPLASLFPLGFGWASGSGMASTQSLYEFFVKPAEDTGADPLRVGAVVSMSAAAGRTMSPVAAVMLVSASLTGANPRAMMRRMALPLLAGLVAVVMVAMLLG